VANTFTWICVATAFATQVIGQETLCSDERFVVASEDDTFTAMLCEAASAATERLATCNIDVPTPILFQHNNNLGQGCLGLYHCGQSTIELRDPAAMAQMLPEDSPFQGVGQSALFASVVAHELTHAAYDLAPCHFDGCLATAEYLAHAMQVWTMPPADQAIFANNLRYDHQISHDEINGMIAVLAPEIFAQKAWLHFIQRPDPCDYAAQIMRGHIHFEHAGP